MTAPSYTTNLSTLDQAESNTNWVEFTGTSTNGYDYNIHGSPQGADADWPYIQNTYAVTQTCTSTKSGYGSLGYDNGSSIGGHGTDGAYLVWQLFANPNYYSYANDGLQVVIGDAVGSFYAWTVGGNDVGVGLYLGWQCHAVNTSVTQDDDCGTYAGSNEEIVGAAVRTTTGIGKGEPHAVDVIRYGRCDAVFEYGDASNGYCTIDGFATQNDSINNRWGLIQKVPGGYLWQGLMSLGTSSNAVDFRDSNRIIFIKWCPKVTTNFNTIEVDNASSRVDMTNFQFIQLDTTTASDGRWVTTADADINLESCSFQDMGTFSFDSNTVANNCVWTRCGQIDTEGADLSGSSVLASTVAADSGAVKWDENLDPGTSGNLDDMTFTIGGNAHHAIEFGDTIPSSMTIDGLTCTGFSSSDNANDSTFYFADTTGTFTLNLTNFSGNATYKSAGCTVNIVTGAVTVQATITDTVGTEIENALVYLQADAKSSGTATTDTTDKLVDTNATFQTDGVAIGDTAFNQTDGTAASVTAVDSQTSLSLSSDNFPDGNENYRVGGSFPDKDTVTIVNSGTTATVTHTGHGMATNDYVYIEGGDIVANEGVFQITVSDVNTYTYTMGSSPGSSPTGTITSTFVALFGLTNSSGVKSTSRVYSVDQLVTGWARKSSSSPYYQPAPMRGTIDTADGLSATGVLVSDE